MIAPDTPQGDGGAQRRGVLSFRKGQILDLARNEGHVTVEALAGQFGVTTQTIRRDLSELAEIGMLDRVHGGAVMPPGAQAALYEDRKVANADAKAAIARLCVAEIPDNSSVALTVGTTTEAVAAALLNRSNLTVVTNSLKVATILSANESLQIVVAGGVLRTADTGLFSEMTIHMFEQFKFDFAVMGTSAIDADGDFLDFDIQEIPTNRAVLRRARRSFIVADHTKFECSAPARVASLRDVDVFFTDRLAPRHRAVCAATGVRVLEAMPSLGRGG